MENLSSERHFMPKPISEDLDIKDHIFIKKNGILFCEYCEAEMILPGALNFKAFKYFILGFNEAHKICGNKAVF